MTTGDSGRHGENIPKTFQEALLRYIWPSRFRMILLALVGIGLPMLALNVDLNKLLISESQEPPRAPPTKTQLGQAHEPPPQPADMPARQLAVTPSSDERTSNQEDQSRCDTTKRRRGQPDFSGRDFQFCDFTRKNLNSHLFYK